jgi:DNA replication protein DnaC
MSALLEAQKLARTRTKIIVDGDTEKQPVKAIAASVVDYAARIAQVRENGGMSVGPFEPEPVCPNCGGSGWFRLGDLPIDHPDFGKAVHCPNELHAEDRLRHIGSVGMLSGEDAKIDLYELAKYHDDSVQVAIKGSGATRASSNMAMLAHFKAIVNSPKRNPLTFVMGPNGNGKSTAAMGLVNALNRANKGPAIYITLVDLIAYVKEAYGQGVGESSEGRFRKIAHSRAIVVDEFEMGTGKVMATEHNFELLNRWFSERYAAAKNGTGVTVLVSNEHPKDIGLNSILSRMKDFKRIANTAPDFRGKENWDFE